MHSRRRAKSSGFTLLELLLVMAILVVLASLSTFAILKIQQGALKKNALIQIESLERACVAYKLHVHSFPAKLEDLYTQPSGMTQTQWDGPYMNNPIPNDPWNHPYTYQPNDAQNRVVITSNGPDGQAGTDDDIPEKK